MRARGRGVGVVESTGAKLFIVVIVVCSDC